MCLNKRILFENSCRRVDLCDRTRQIPVSAIPANVSFEIVFIIKSEYFCFDLQTYLGHPKNKHELLFYFHTFDEGAN